jgi:putative hemolysin
MMGRINATVHLSIYEGGTKEARDSCRKMGGGAMRKRRNRGGESDQCTLSACVKPHGVTLCTSSVR